MGFFSPVWPQVCQQPAFAGYAVCGPISSSAKKTLEMLGDELEQLESSLGILEFVPDFREHADKIAELRGKIGVVRGAISKTLAYASTYEDGKELLSALRRIRQIDSKNNPAAAAKAYGAAMTSFGRLVAKLGPPASVVGPLIAAMGEIFAKVVGDIVPQLRGTHQRVDEQVMQGGDRSIWEKP